MTRSIFGNAKYSEIVRLQKSLRKAKTAEEKKRLKIQIELVESQLKEEEKAAEAYFERH